MVAPLVRLYSTKRTVFTELAVLLSMYYMVVDAVRGARICIGLGSLLYTPIHAFKIYDEEFSPALIYVCHQWEEAFYQLRPNIYMSPGTSDFLHVPELNNTTTTRPPISRTQKKKKFCGRSKDGLMSR